MYTIKKPTVSVEGDEAAVIAPIDVDGCEKRVTFRFDARYAPYLTVDRCDAFAVLLLYFAMRDGHDIQSELPMTARLHYQLRHILCEAIREYDPAQHVPELLCPLESAAYPMGTAVGTSASCGVDAMAAIATHTGPDAPEGFGVSLLCHYNIGQFYSEDGLTVFEDSRRFRRGNAQQAADEMGLPLFRLDSDFSKEFPVKFLRVCTYNNCAVPLMFQRLFCRYLHPSSTLPSEFTFRHLLDPADYELLILPCLCTDNVQQLAVNVHMTRVDKIACIKDFAPARRHLLTCARSDTGAALNCGGCAKCLRTLPCLDALGALDDFAGVFDVPRYRKRRTRDLAYILAIRRSDVADGIIPALKAGPGIPLGSWLMSVPMGLMVAAGDYAEAHLSAARKERVRGFMQRLGIKMPF